MKTGKTKTTNEGEHIMGNVIINTTGEIETLSIIDRNSGVNWIADLLGNAGIHADEEGNYHMDREDFNWWVEYINGYQATENEIAEMAEKTGEDYYKIRQRVINYTNESNDMEYECFRAIQMLEEIAEEYGVEYARA